MVNSPQVVFGLVFIGGIVCFATLLAFAEGVEALGDWLFPEEKDETI